MFRQKALDRLKSPEDLDHLLTVIPMRSWFVVLTLGFLATTALAWSFLGRIPITVNGFGVLINPGNVKGIQSLGTGQVKELRVRVGQQVKEGDVLAVIDQTNMQTELAQLRDKHDTMEAFNAELDKMDADRLAMEEASSEEQRQFIVAEIKKGKALEARLQAQHQEFAKRQKENLLKTQSLSVGLNDALRKRVKTIKTLRQEGLSSDDMVLNVQSRFMDSEAKMADFIVRLEELELGKIQQEQSEQERLNRLADLELQLIKLNIREKQLHQEVKQAKQARDQQLKDLSDSMGRLENQLEEQGQILSPNDGRILEITIAGGRVIQAGSRIGTIEIDDPNASLKNLAYMSVKGGKLITPGDRIRVTPATVERERYGSIIGEVTKVSSFPITQEGAVNVVGSAEVAEALMKQGGAIEIEAELERDDDPDSISGYKWTSKGPPLQLSAGTTTTVRVTVEERAPITYVLPILRTWVLGQKDDQKPSF